MSAMASWPVGENGMFAGNGGTGALALWSARITMRPHRSRLISYSMSDCSDTGLLYVLFAGTRCISPLSAIIFAMFVASAIFWGGLKNAERNRCFLQHMEHASL